MRQSTFLFLFPCVVTLLFLVHSVWTPLTLLVVDGSEDAMTRAELSGSHSVYPANSSQMIPKIIHQTYKDENIPAVWREAQRSCLLLHPDWEYRLWTDDMSEQFIAEEFPWFLETFRGYEYPIQRADAIRYFALAHFGGLYIDLDDGCNRPLEPLLSYPAWVRKTSPTGISNDVMGAVPHHPFFLRVIEELQSYNHRWLLPYITVMGSTGPLFLSLVWRHYSSEGFNCGDDTDGGRVQILFQDEYMHRPWSFFTHHQGSSWHQYDVQLIFWMRQNWALVIVVCSCVVLTLLSCFWLMYQRFILRTAGPPHWKKPPMSKRLPVWWRLSASPHDLVLRHEV